MTLQNFLLAILTGSFAIGPAIFMLLERLPALDAIHPEYKRWIVAAASAVMGLAAWALALWLGYVEEPPSYSPEFVASGIWQYGVLVGYSAFTSATMLHGHLALSKNTVILTPDTKE